MATSKKAASERQGPSKLPAKEQIIDIDLSAFAHQEMIRYATAVNEDRAVPEFHDGFKPVQRRVLYAAFEGGYRHNKAPEKSAKLIGKTLGDYHPHGDVACYEAAVNMVNMRYPLLDGDGNFGDFMDPKGYAAYRYTNIRLSKFSERVFFDSFYTPVMQYVSNYDSKGKEPLFTLALLPNLLFNTTFSIGVGVTAQFPRFTLESVAKMLALVFSGTPADVKNCLKTLVFTTKLEGVIAEGQAARIKALFTDGKGSLTYDSPYTVDVQHKEMKFTGFAPFGNFETAAKTPGAKKDPPLGRLDKAMLLPFVVSASDSSELGDKVGSVTVVFKSNSDSKNLPQLTKQVAAIFRESESYFNNVTVRTLEKDESEKYRDEATVKLKSSTIPELINRWCKWRISLEVKACNYQIKLKDLELRKLEVLRIAIANRALIIKALDKKMDDAALAEYLSKTLKITLDEANTILDFRVRQLKALDDARTVAEMKRLRDLKAGYVKRRDNPNAYCTEHVHALAKEFT
jgi:topoisomerase-4 subunit A